jgi:DNA-binding PadR family transcriptional regulator
VRAVRRPSRQTEDVLSALASRSPEWSYGYELSKTLELKAGTMYPILIRLADRGLVESRWESEAPEGRPPRHLYRLSAAGADLLDGLRSPLGSADPVADRSARTTQPGPTGAIA